MFDFYAATNVLVKDSLVECNSSTLFWYTSGALERSVLIHRNAIPSTEPGVFRGMVGSTSLLDVAVLSDFPPGVPIVPQFYDGVPSSFNRVYFGEHMRWGGAYVQPAASCNRASPSALASRPFSSRS